MTNARVLFAFILLILYILSWFVHVLLIDAIDFIKCDLIC